jgi:methylated-DNA-[protein]-cysteine S-methyltransferase
VAARVFYDLHESPLGTLLATSDGEALTALLFRDAPAPGWQREPAFFAGLHEQLAAWFQGELRAFDLPLAPEGTPFQQRVWTALRTIPYGATWSYLALARHLGSATLTRAVGAANGRNPLAILVPCHRVVGADGSLTGYAGGLDRKRWLLAHERGRSALFAEADS